MFDSHPGKFSKTRGKYPSVILANFQKREENVRLSSWQIFKNGRKMSNCHPGKFSKTGGKCPTVALANFQKREENVQLSVILANFQKWVENVRLSSWQILKNRRKISVCHPGKFSKTGGKCPTVILANFQKREENIRLSSWQIFKNGRKNF